MTKFLMPHYEEWAKLYSSGMSARSIAKQFNCSDFCIGYGLMKVGMARRDSSHARRIYSINEEYFDVIDSDSKAYWLGFISADGYIARDSNRLVVDLSANDADTIRELLSDLNSDLEPNFHKGGCGKARNMVRIQINNKHLLSALKSHGMTNKKSLTLEFCEHIPTYLLNAYIRGYFDGDGSIYFDKTGKPYFAIVGTLPFLKRVQHILIVELGLNDTKIRSKGNISEMRYIGKNNVTKIRNWLFRGNVSRFMKRKRDKLDSIG